MLSAVKFPKSRFNEFFALLQSFGKVQAPVRVSNSSFAFKEIRYPEDIAFEAVRTILPPKKFFYPQHETVLRYDENGIHDCPPEHTKQVLFGVHPCDLAGLAILDKIFTAAPGDTHYISRRQLTLIVGLSCMPDKHCFCNAMGTGGATTGYDLFLTDIGDSFFCQIKTQAGLELIDKDGLFSKIDESDESAFADFWKTREEAFTTKLDTTSLASMMQLSWDHPVWEELGNRCLSCGNCTPVCPTCYCFDLVDIASLNGTSGERVREWDSCQFVGFAQVAGDYNFRPGPVDRLKFWYQHKLHGFDDPYGFKTCVGCGRCTVSCPSGIDNIPEVIVAIQSGKDADVKHLTDLATQQVKEGCCNDGKNDRCGGLD